MRLAAGPSKVLIEFGLRRAQGPDGGLSASKYSYLGGFDSTANVLAGKLCGIAVKGTIAHAFVMAHSQLEDLASRSLRYADGSGEADFVSVVLSKAKTLRCPAGANIGELTAFIAYAQAFPDNFLALVDTYDSLVSGVPNFLAVAWALLDFGYQPRGVRLDSGDLAYLSKTIRKTFREVDREFMDGRSVFSSYSIVASNDINEEVLLALNREGHEIDVFGIGTHLVTCQRQPALGCVYKLVEIRNQPRIKFSEDFEKMLIPGCKAIFRLIGQDGIPLVDLLQMANEPPPVPGKQILVRHPFVENKRARVTPQQVVPLLVPVFVQGVGVRPDSLLEARTRCQQQLSQIREDHVRPLNPTPYKISVSEALYVYMRNLWQDELPIKELC